MTVISSVGKISLLDTQYTPGNGYGAEYIDSSWTSCLAHKFCGNSFYPTLYFV